MPCGSFMPCAALTKVESISASWCWTSGSFCGAMPLAYSAASPYSPKPNPRENLWDEIREKIFKNDTLKSMDDVYDKLEEAALERNWDVVKSITSFPYIVRSL